MLQLKQQRDIARQSAMLTQGHHRLVRRRQALRHRLLTYCKQPGTLCVTLLTGAALGFVLPSSQADGRHNASDVASPGSGQLMPLLRLALVSFGPALLQRLLRPDASSPNPSVTQAWPDTRE